MTGLVHASGRPIRDYEFARARARADIGGAAEPAFEAARTGGTYLSEWPSALQSADRDWLPSRRPATARVHERVRNDAVAASAVARKRNAAVGKGWRLSSRPNYRLLGIDREAARELGQAIEDEFSVHAYGHAFESDAERRLTFGQQLRLTASHIAIDGEALGLGEWADDEPTRYKTRLRIVDPIRLCNPNGRLNSEYLRDGVEFNGAGVPFRYHFRERSAGDFGGAGSFRWKHFDRFTEWGRPQVFHCMEVERAGQTRGISRFVAVLKSFRALSRFTDATLESATVNALIVAFMKSNAGPAAASESFEAKDVAAWEQTRQQHYEDNPVNLVGGVRIPVLPQGDELQMQTAAKDVGSFDSFVRSVIRLIAAALGVTYEELSMDYSQTNYSSARAAMVHAWAETQVLASIIEAQLVKPYYVAWLEEAFDSGYIKTPDGAPDFYDAPDAYAQSRWIGPGRGYIDQTKEVDAAAARIEARISTLEDECAEQGKDWEEVLEQQALEDAKLAQLGLQRIPGALSLAAAASRQPQPEQPAASAA